MPRTKSTRWQDFLSDRITTLTLLIVLASLLGLLGRHHWLLDMFSHFVFHYAFIAAVFAVLLFMLGRSRWALFAVLLALLNGMRLLPYWQAPAGALQAADVRESVRVLQFNVQQDNHNIRAIMDWLKSNRAGVDIVILLEVNPAWKPYLQVLQADYPDATWELLDNNFGIAVLTRLRTRSLEVRDIGGHGLPSVVMTVLSPESSTPLTLYATHPLPPIGGSLSEFRDSQLAAIAAALAGNPQQHLILSGDLNATPWSAPFEKLVDETGLKDAQAGLGYTGTWPALLPPLAGIPIDHTLISAPLQATHREIGPALGSDHYPVITTLSIH